MTRWSIPIFALLLASAPAPAHFIWIVPDALDRAKAKVILSETLEPDVAVSIAGIASTKLFAIDSHGKVAHPEWKKADHAYIVDLPPWEGFMIAGMCEYGVMQRGEGKPFLLAYYPKFIRGAFKPPSPIKELPLEILPQQASRFLVTFRGQPLPDVQIVVVTPTGEAKDPVTTDSKGEVSVVVAAPGNFGIRARHFEKRAGESKGKKYEEIRHYATLVVEGAKDKPAAAKEPGEGNFPPLPEAVSSFGAAEADGWVYAYGGHLSKTHNYSTEAVVGSFRRLNAADPHRWEELPGGPKSQGLAMVAYKGKIYRIGGMQPRNAPGQPTDNHSLSSCAVYDPATKTWTPLPDLPGARSSHDAVVAGSKIIVVGGWKMNGADKESDWYSTAAILDLDSKNPEWKEIKQPFQRRALNAAVLDGKVYVLGGINDEDVIELRVDIYDPVKDVWTTGAPLPGPKRNGFSPAACTVGGRLYVSTADGKISRLSADGAAWEPVGQLKQPRIVHRMVSVGDHLIVTVGGASKGDNVALTEVLRP